MTPKSFAGLYLPVETMVALRTRAEGVGVSYSELADLFIRRGLDSMPEDVLRAWAAKRPSTRGRLGGGLTKAERSALDAMGRLVARGTAEGVYRFELAEVANEAGLLRRDAYLALKRLQGRGLVSGADGTEQDRHGRPVSSVWRRVA